MQSIQKRRDIAVLLSFGVRTQQIQRIFMLHGLAIGALGTFIGLVAGYAIAIVGQRYEAFALDPRVYGISYVPFEADIVDGGVIALVALLVSFAATIYPSRRAVRVVPVEVLRYE
jgi:lipoprotein-releasing system permease protein